jgi:uncharacterized tellurite resistance protein B-like protein
MPIIAVVVLTLVFWGAYWFVRMGGIDHFQAKSAQRKNEARLAKARESERTAALRAIDDPRDAAIILMLLVARANGDPTREQIATIEQIAATTFGFEQELTGRMTQARFIAGRADSFEQAAGLFSDLFMKRLTGAERQQLVGMIEQIAQAEHEPPSPAQAEALAVLRRRLAFAQAR